MYNELPDWSLMDALFGGVGGFLTDWAKTLPPPFSYILGLIGICINLVWAPISLALFVAKHGLNVSTKTKFYLFVVVVYIVGGAIYGLGTLVAAALL